MNKSESDDTARTEYPDGAIVTTDDWGKPTGRIILASAESGDRIITCKASELVEWMINRGPASIEIIHIVS